MLAPIPFANAIACAAVVIYVLFYLLKFIAPPFFELIFNSQFFGVDIASQVPSISFANLAGFLIAIAAITWIWGYLVARFYNKFAK